jgi:ketosteroid isomerase-like protein
MKPMSVQSSPSFSQIVQQWQDAANKQNAAAIAALYTADAPTKAVLIVSQGPLHGQSEIQQGLQAQFQAGWANIKLTDDEDHPQGNWAWSVGTWSSTFGGAQVNGWWSAVWVQQGTAWKIQQQSIVTFQQ